MNITISITELMFLALIFLALIILVLVIYEILGNVNKKFDKVDQRLKDLEDRATIANLKEVVDRLEKKGKEDQNNKPDKKNKD